jgi:hypothetical protein
MLKPIALLFAVALSTVACGTTGEVPPQTPAGSSTGKPEDPSKPEGPTPDGSDPAAPVMPIPESPPRD